MDDRPSTGPLGRSEKAALVSGSSSALLGRRRRVSVGWAAAARGWVLAARGWAAAPRGWVAAARAGCAAPGSGGFMLWTGCVAEWAGCAAAYRLRRPQFYIDVGSLAEAHAAARLGHPGRRPGLARPARGRAQLRVGGGRITGRRVVRP